MTKRILKWITFSVVIFVAVATVDFLTWRNQQIKRLESYSRLAQTS